MKPAVLSAREEEPILGVRPEHIQIHTEPIFSVMVPATVEIDEPMGTDSLLWLKLEQQSLSVRIDADLNCQEGTIYHLEFSIPKSSIFRKDTEERI
jgi:multiple sugar transport system ATP-binding protein